MTRPRIAGVGAELHRGVRGGQEGQRRGADRDEQRPRTPPGPGASAAIACRPPNAPPAATTQRSRIVTRRADSSAPTTDPTASIELSRP